MLNDNQLRKKILAFAVAPSLLVCGIVLLSFAWLQATQTQTLKQEKFALAERLVAVHAPRLLVESEFKALVDALLSIKPLRNISLFDAQGQLLASEGLPSNIGRDGEIAPFDTDTHEWQDHNAVYRLIPVLDQTQSPSGWVLLEMDRAIFSLLRHQGFLLALIVAILALVVSFYFGLQLRAFITQPLRQLYAGVAGYLSGNIHNPILINEDVSFQEIADAIGELVKKQQMEQNAMQSYLEEYTQELRETLETVEIQNIELDMARKNALQSSRAKSEFLANASHELRTPLNGIIGFSNLLLKTNLSNQQTDYLSTIEQSAQGLLTIINDILDISRLETGQLILEYKAVSVYQTIEDVLKLLSPSAHEKNLRLITLIDPHVPENLLGDPLRLKQVITNLVSNAVKFSDQGTIVIRANFIGETDNQVHLKVSVSDNGIGLTVDQQSRLFESFTQTDTADNRMHGGTGLGLAIARGLVHRMHGEIGVDSEPHRGSTFWFTAKLGLNNRESARNRQNDSLRDTCVLVYDNDPLGRSEITHLLDNWGAEYVETDNFSEICELVSNQDEGSRIQLAILDAQVNDQLFDRQQLRLCIERLNSEFHIAVIVLALPNICRMLEPVLEKLQAAAIARPVSHNQLHRTICRQLGIATSASTTTPDYQPPRLRINKPARILAVDDNAANLRLVSELLKDLGAEVRVASSGSEALTICSKERFDLILMDIQMPGMDGLETTRKLREQEGQGRRTPIAALTAHAVNEQKTRLLRAGMDDYLSKPVSDVQLRHLINRWMNNSVNHLPAEEIEQITEEHAAGSLSPVVTDTSVFDLSEALAKTQQKPELARDMFAMLVASLPETAHAIHAAQNAGDIAALQETVHKFHGGCCYCGVPALREATNHVHTLLQHHDYEQLEPAVAALLMRIEELQAWVAEHDLDNLFLVN